MATFLGLYAIRVLFHMPTVYPSGIYRRWVFLLSTTIEGLNFFQKLLCWCFTWYLIPPCFVLQYVILIYYKYYFFNLSIVIYLSLVNTPKSISLCDSSPDFNFFVCQCILMYFFRSVSAFTEANCLYSSTVAFGNKMRNALYIKPLYSHKWQCGISVTSFPISQIVVRSGVC